jgi:hypothetical protein
MEKLIEAANVPAANDASQPRAKGLSKKRLVDLIANTPLDRWVSRAYWLVDMAVMGAFHEDEGLRLIREIKREDGQPLCRASELYMVYSLAKAQQALPGDFAEVGVYKGATAKLICSVKLNRDLHLFDTFQGLPAVVKEDHHYAEGMFAADVTKVRQRLSGFPGVRFYPGFFPATATPVAERRFAFVHLDVDLYQSTRDALAFFYPRLTPGGIILSHDHPTGEGVRKAFAEFLENKPEKVIQLPLGQGMIIKQNDS